jgi:hypothetical protein
MTDFQRLIYVATQGEGFENDSPLTILLGEAVEADGRSRFLEPSEAPMATTCKVEWELIHHFLGTPSPLFALCCALPSLVVGPSVEIFSVHSRSYTILRCLENCLERREITTKVIRCKKLVRA